MVPEVEFDCIATLFPVNDVVPARGRRPVSVIMGLTW